MSEHVNEHRRERGRPPAKIAKSSLTAWVPQTHHDRLTQLALKHDISVSKVVCRLLDQALRKNI